MCSTSSTGNLGAQSAMAQLGHTVVSSGLKWVVLQTFSETKTELCSLVWERLQIVSYDISYDYATVTLLLEWMQFYFKLDACIKCTHILEKQGVHYLVQISVTRCNEQMHFCGSQVLVVIYTVIGPVIYRKTSTISRTLVGNKIK